MLVSSVLMFILPKSNNNNVNRQTLAMIAHFTSLFRASPRSPDSQKVKLVNEVNRLKTHLITLIKENGNTQVLPLHCEA